jgi:addiction module RelE/StbE family toxin
MTIRFSKNFTRSYDKLSGKLKLQTNRRIKLFIQDRSLPQLHDHALVGEYTGYRSINITGDIRALYYQDGDEIVIFAFIGTHSQLYK